MYSASPDFPRESPPPLSLLRGCLGPFSKESNGPNENPGERKPTITYRKRHNEGLSVNFSRTDREVFVRTVAGALTRDDAPCLNRSRMLAASNCSLSVFRRIIHWSMLFRIADYVFYSSVWLVSSYSNVPNRRAASISARASLNSSTKPLEELKNNLYHYAQ